MHLFVLVNALPQGHAQFRNMVESYTQGTGGHPVAEELRFYQIRMKEADQKNVLKMLVPFESIGHIERTGGSLAKIMSFARRFLPIKSLEKEKKEIRKIPNLLDTTKYTSFYCHIIGKADDEKAPNGQELI